jgi:hypothetical protein
VTIKQLVKLGNPGYSYGKFMTAPVIGGEAILEFDRVPLGLSNMPYPLF